MSQAPHENPQPRPDQRSPQQIRRDNIEQAIARAAANGRPPIKTAMDATGASYEDVRKVLHGMDNAATRDMRAYRTQHSQDAKPCGTHAAYVRHRANGEDPCQPCRAAQAEYDKTRRAA